MRVLHTSTLPVSQSRGCTSWTFVIAHSTGVRSSIVMKLRRRQGPFSSLGQVNRAVSSPPSVYKIASLSRPRQMSDVPEKACRSDEKTGIRNHDR